MGLFYRLYRALLRNMWSSWKSMSCTIADSKQTMRIYGSCTNYIGLFPDYLGLFCGIYGTRLWNVWGFSKEHVVYDFGFQANDENIELFNGLYRVLLRNIWGSFVEAVGLWKCRVLHDCRFEENDENTGLFYGLFRALLREYIVLLKEHSLQDCVCGFQSKDENTGLMCGICMLGSSAEYMGLFCEIYGALLWNLWGS